MPRISNEVKSKYSMVGAQGPDAPCFYCGAPSAMDDLSPHPKASEIDRTMYPELWTITRTCRKCWTAIYTANIAGKGLKFNVPLGCMTIPHKQLLVGGTPMGKPLDSMDFMSNFNRTLVLPNGITKLEDNYVFDGRMYSVAEIEALQGPIACLMSKLPRPVILKAFAGAMATGELDPDRENDYLTLLGMGTPTW